MKTLLIFSVVIGLAGAAHGGDVEPFGGEPSPQEDDYAQYQNCVDELVDELTGKGVSEADARAQAEENCGFILDGEYATAEIGIMGEGPAAGRFGEGTIPLRIIDNKVFNIKPIDGGGPEEISLEDCVRILVSLGKTTNDAWAICRGEKDLSEEEVYGGDPAGGAGELLFEGETAVAIVDKDGRYSTIPFNLMMSAIHAVENAELDSFVTKEGVLKVGLAAGGAWVVWHAGTKLTPLGWAATAFAAAIGLGPASAEGLCDRYYREEGFDIFSTLSVQEKLQEVRMCPELAGKVFELGEALK